MFISRKITSMLLHLYCINISIALKEYVLSGCLRRERTQKAPQLSSCGALI